MVYILDGVLLDINLMFILLFLILDIHLPLLERLVAIKSYDTYTLLLVYPTSISTYYQLIAIYMLLVFTLSYTIYY